MPPSNATSADQPLVAIVMAAGKGTRMRSDVPKVLHEIAGEPLVGHVLLTLAGLGVVDAYVVVGHGAEAVKASLPASATPVLQAEQLGTGHAVDQVRPHLDGFTGTVLILSGDVPLLTEATLRALIQTHTDAGAALTILSAELDDATGYGRILRNAAGAVTGIVEHKDASAAQRDVREVNLGTYAVSWPLLKDALAALTPNNAQGEYYLTDAIAHFVTAGHRVTAHRTPDPAACMGINTRFELARLQGEYNRRTARRWMEAGVTFVSPDTTIVGPRVRLGRDVVLEPGAILLGETKVGDGTRIGAYSQLKDAAIGADVLILNSYIVDSTVEDGAHVGPYAHLRGRAHIGRDVRLGNFVEVKNSRLGTGTKAAHLAYLGDAEVGAGVNIGCGVITVNYDGVKKSKTIIEDGAFVGSNSNLVAPVTVGAEGFVAAGSTITEDVPAGALAIGRGRQANKPGWVSSRRGAPTGR